MKNNCHFNIRAYGIYIDKKLNILLSEEQRFNMFMRKFPGGGLEFGEGLKDCIRREWKEETNTNIVHIEHFYTTDFFQPSFLHKDKKVQIISVYFIVKPDSENFISNDPNLKLVKYKLSALTPEMLTFPIDRYVLNLLQKKYKA